MSGSAAAGSNEACAELIPWRGVELEASKRQPVTPMDSRAKELSGAKILIVEDEPLIAMDHAEWLAAAGAAVVGPFARISDALLALERGGIDVAVVDFVLTDGNSEPLQEALERGRIPFIVATAYPPVLVRRAKGQIILTKPVTGDSLRSAVAGALGAREDMDA